MNCATGIWAFEAYNPASQIEVWDASSALYDYKELTGYQRNNAYNGLNQDTAIAAISGGYDASGNLTNDGDRTFTYDAENRLLTAIWPSADRKIELKYDPLGRAYTRIITVISTGSVTTDYWLYDGVNLIDEYTSGGNQRRRYVHGTGTDEPLVWFEGSTNVATPNLLFANHQGSIVAYANYSGVKQAIYTYGPWGEPTDEVGNANWTGPRFRYTGQVALPEVRLYYYKARVYDPVMGRFLQTDPIGSEDDLNLYAYVGGDPINGSDPTGTKIAFDSNTSKEFQEAARLALKEVAKSDAGAAAILELHESDETFYITSSDGDNGFGPDDLADATNLGVGSGGTIFLNLSETTSDVIDQEGGNIRPVFVGVAHELGHALDASRGEFIPGETITEMIPGTTPDAERTAVWLEDEVRAAHDLPLRGTYFASEKNQKKRCNGRLCPLK